MPFINRYIAKVEQNDKILLEWEKLYSNKWNWENIFKNKNPMVLEIWIWLWNFFTKISDKNKDKNYIWMEIRYKRLDRTFNKLAKNGNSNFMLIKDKWENIDKIFTENEIEKTYLFFPDPWENKESQRKNRLVNKLWIEKLYYITKQNGDFIFKTDSLDYFESSLEIVKQTNWEIDIVSYDYQADETLFDKNLITEFEEMFRKDNLQINYLRLVKK